MFHKISFCFSSGVGVAHQVIGRGQNLQDLRDSSCPSPSEPAVFCRRGLDATSSSSTSCTARLPATPILGSLPIPECCMLKMCAISHNGQLSCVYDSVALSASYIARTLLPTRFHKHKHAIGSVEQEHQTDSRRGSMRSFHDVWGGQRSREQKFVAQKRCVTYQLFLKGVQAYVMENLSEMCKLQRITSKLQLFGTLPSPP